MRTNVRAHSSFLPSLTTGRGGFAREAGEGVMGINAGPHDPPPAPPAKLGVESYAALGNAPDVWRIVTFTLFQKLIRAMLSTRSASAF
jgi:hypothetical protein